LKEAEQLLGTDKPDVDALTRGQQKKIKEISEEAPSTPKKVRIQKQGTMAATAKVRNCKLCMEGSLNSKTRHSG
jgi:hypothetical protein